MSEFKTQGLYEGKLYTLVLSKGQAGHPCGACAFNDRPDACRAAGLACTAGSVWKEEKNEDNKGTGGGDLQ